MSFAVVFTELVDVVTDKAGQLPDRCRELEDVGEITDVELGADKVREDLLRMVAIVGRVWSRGWVDRTGMPTFEWMRYGRITDSSSAMARPPFSLRASAHGNRLFRLENSALLAMVTFQKGTDEVLIRGLTCSIH